MLIDIVCSEWNGKYIYKFNGKKIVTHDVEIQNWLCIHSKVSALLPQLLIFDNVVLEDFEEVLERSNDPYIKHIYR